MAYFLWRGHLEYMMWLEFSDTNNEVEHEALNTLFKLANTLRAVSLVDHNDSHSIAWQVKEEYEAKK